MKNNYKHFQDRIRMESNADGLTNAQFVFSAENSTTLQLLDDPDNIIVASVVNLQEKDMAYIYTSIDDHLEVGQVWSIAYKQKDHEWDINDFWNRYNIFWMIMEEIIVIKEVKWHKYVAYKCNIDIDGLWGYWLGPEKNFINVTLREKTVLQSLQHPVLVLPASASYHIGDKILIGDRAWLIQEEDHISTAGLIYYSLRASTISKEVLDEQKHHMENQSQVPDMPIGQVVADGYDNIVGPGAIITVATEGGYFRTNNSLVQVTNISATSVTFVVPYGITSLTITTKQNDELVSTSYQVVNE